MSSTLSFFLEVGDEPSIGFFVLPSKAHAYAVGGNVVSSPLGEGAFHHLTTNTEYKSGGGDGEMILDIPDLQSFRDKNL